MALVVPLASSASVIENILFKVRRGIALSRNASQVDPTTGVMVDLPERIDFEMTLLKSHQSLTNNRILDSLDEVITSEVSGDSDSETSYSIEENADSTRSSSAEVDESKAGDTSIGNGRGNGFEKGFSKGNGQGNGNGQGQGNGKGQGNGQGKGNGKGQGNGQGNGNGQGQGNGKGNGNGKGEGNGRGEGNGKGEGNGQGKGNGKGEGKGNGGGDEQRCTYQQHTANREYDKFDTDTGEITGISL